MRQGECQKFFGAVIFQVGHRPVQVTDWSDQKGAVLLFSNEGGTESPSDYCSEWGSEQLNEWASEWVAEWRARADNMLTDWQREATVISIDPTTQTPSLGQWFFHRPPGHSQMLDYHLAWLHLWANILSDTTQSVSFLNYHTIFKQLAVFFSP